MSDLDRKAVESMVMMGMSREAIYNMFPSLTKEEVDEIYTSIKGKA